MTRIGLDPSKHKLRKAGLNAWGWEKEEEGKFGLKDRLYTVVGCTEGRFMPKVKALVPTKGGIDAHEKPIAAAVREFMEETGFPLREFMGEENYLRLLSGETLENVENEKFPGINIKYFSPKLIADHVYVTAHGTKNGTHWFAMEIEGIKNIGQYLKRARYGNDPARPDIEITTDQIRDGAGLPELSQMLEIMRTGIVPAGVGSVWADPVDRQIIEEPVLPRIEKAWLKKHGINRKQITADEWQPFLSEVMNDDWKALSEDIDSIKYDQEKRGIVSDKGNFKLDTKDYPLTYYQEFAEVLPLQTVLERNAAIARGQFDRDPRAQSQAQRAKYFADASFGTYTGDRRETVSKDEAIATSQWLPVMQYLEARAPMEVALASMRVDHHSLKALEHGQKPQLNSIVSGYLDAGERWQNHVRPSEETNKDQTPSR